MTTKNLTYEELEKAEKIFKILNGYEFDKFYNGDFERHLTSDYETNEEGRKLKDTVLKEINHLFND